MKENISFYESAVVINDIITKDMVSMLKNYAYKGCRGLEDVLQDYSVTETTNPNNIKYAFFDLSDGIYKNQIRSEVKHVIQEKIIKKTLEVLEDKFPSLVQDQIGIAVSRSALPYHADSEIPKNKNDQFLGVPNNKISNNGFIKPINNEWIPSLNPYRAYSTVIYLEDQFEGGETIFPIKNLDIKPKIGKMLGFPSSRDYIHGVNPSLGAPRITLNIWYRFDVSVTNNYNPTKIN